jgi:hypothetical protein
MTVARLPAAAASASALAVSVDAFAPCVANGARSTALPAWVVAAQPPPSVALSPALLRSLAATAGGSSDIDIHVVQWGWSHVPETAGWTGLS